jgi:ribosomal protein L21E
MAQFTIEIPDQLLPALVVEFGLVQGSTDATTPEEYFQASIVETVRQRAEAYKVGPYFVGAVEPKFLIDGTPNPAYQGADAIVLPPAPEPEPEVIE